MASKGGKYHKKSSKSSKKGFKKTTGGASYRNYSKKSKNLDYKYRILDIADTNQTVWYQQAATFFYNQVLGYYNQISTYIPLGDGKFKEQWIKQKFTVSQAILEGYFRTINTACHFIPVSTSQMVAKNVSLEVRCKYPFAYCLFQNTKQFRDVFLRFMTASMTQLIAQDITSEIDDMLYYCQEHGADESDMNSIRDLCAMMYCPVSFNPFGLDDAGFVIPMLNNSGEDWTNIQSNMSPTSAMWGQICRAQSSYREVRSANNAGEYFSTINAYYTKASTYLTTSSAKDPFAAGYKKGGIITSSDVDKNTFYTLQLCSDSTNRFEAKVTELSNYKIRSQNYDTLFNSGDIIVCILPCWFINSINPQAQGQVSRPSVDSTQVMRDAIPSINTVRHYYVLNQDTGIKEVLNNDPTTAHGVVVTEIEKKVANVPTSNNTGNAVQNKTNGLIRNIMLRSQGIQVPPILRSDLDDTAQKSNCVVVDEKCYDEANQELEMQAYMDLQPVPANAGDAILEDVEGEDTMNCNAIVSCGNKTDSETLLDASVSNTGPQVYQTTDNSITLNGNSGSINFGYGYNVLSTYQAQAQEQVDPYVIRAEDYQQLNYEFATYNINTSALQQLVSFVNQFIYFRLVIPAFYQNSQQQTISYFSFNDQYPSSQPTKTKYVYGYQPDGTSNNTYLELTLPFGFGQYQPSGYSASQSCLMWAYPCLAVLKDGESATGTISITPLAFEAIQNLLNRKIVQTQDSIGAIIQTYDLSEVCGIHYDDSTDLAYGPTGLALHPFDIYNYMILWMQQYISATGASKAWKKIKGFFCKVGKFIKDKAFPFIKKVADKVAGIVPAPYGTVISAVGTGVDMIQSTINVIGAKKTATNAPQDAVQDDTVTDYFTVIPQYRLAASDEPARIEEQGTDWVDGEPMQVPVSQYGETAVHSCVHKLANHPQYRAIRQSLQGVSVNGLDVGAFCQQRIKVIFKKTGVPPSVARAYKAMMMLGSDTQYINSNTDFQTVSTDTTTQ